jgi:hypothetical protein
MDEKTGYAVVTPNRILKIRIANEASIYTAELSAISKVLWGDLLRFTQLSPGHGIHVLKIKSHIDRNTRRVGRDWRDENC